MPGPAMTSLSRSAVLNEVRSKWTSVLGKLRQLDPTVQVKPKNATDIFKIDEGIVESVRINVSPVIFQVPQKAGTSREATTYVVVRGTIDFGQESRDGRLSTTHFATNVGYFREEEGGLKHVYGAHYDLDDSLIAHPVFHSQLSTHAHFIDLIKAEYRAKADSDLTDDLMKNIPGTFRVPTAQMDFFSVVLQICSDHLVNEKSTKKDKSHYKQVVKICEFFVGCGSDHLGLSTARELLCTRSPHWYTHA